MRPLKALISKNTIHRAHTGKLKIENPKYTDLLIPGNIVEIESNGKLHHGIVMNTHDYNLKFNKRASTTFVIVTLNYDTEYVSNWDCHYFKKSFPNANDSATVIKNIYDSSIDISKIKDVKDIVKLYKEFDLIPF